MADALAPAAKPVVRLRDADFNHAFDVGTGWRIDEPNVIALPLDTPAAQWLADVCRRQRVNMTADLNGRRWSGRLYFTLIAQRDGFQGKFLTARFGSEEEAAEWLSERRRKFGMKP